jgi:hypothetical protein
MRAPRVLLWLLLSSLLISCDLLTRGCSTEPVPDPNVADPNPPVPDEVCSEERREVALSAKTPVGVPDDLLPYVIGFHTGALIWSNNNNRTSIELEVWDVRAYFVESKPGPEYMPDNNDRTCATRIELVVQCALNTGDQRIQQEAELTLRAYGTVEAFGSMYLPYDVLGGAYDPKVGGLCFQGLIAKVLLGDTGFSGSFSNDYTQGTCETTNEKHSTRAAGHWGTRWQSY